MIAFGQAPKKAWVNLFNGKNLDGWNIKIHHHEYNENFGNTFRVLDKKIIVSYDQYGKFNDQFGHLYYKTPFSFFHLKAEYRFKDSLQPGAPEYTLLNSGIMYHSQDPKTILKEQDWPISIELQLLAGLGDGKPRPTGNMCSPGTDIEYQGKKYPGHCLNSTSPTINRDEWVKVELIVLGDSLIQHYVNGKMVLEYNHPTMGGGVANRYDPAIWEPGKPLKEGFIALQSEGQPVEFKNIEILNLKGCKDPSAKNYKSYVVQNDPSDCKY
ncbi:MAG: DUF1080 domain-containing protein [Saprospiraceae bacterium]